MHEVQRVRKSLVFVVKLNMHVYYVVIADVAREREQGAYFGSTPPPLDFVTCQLRMPVMELI